MSVVAEGGGDSRRSISACAGCVLGRVARVISFFSRLGIVVIMIRDGEMSG